MIAGDALGRLRDYLAVDHRRIGPREIAIYVGIGILLAAAAVVGIMWSTGLDRVSRLAQRLDWTWVLIALAATFVSHVGYLIAYRQVARHNDGPDIPPLRAAALVVTGFGLLVPRSGFTLDSAAMCEHGASAREARQRVLSLSLLEYAVLGPAAFAAAWALLLQHGHAQAGLLPSWVIGVPAGTAVTLLLLRIRKRVRSGPSALRPLAHTLDGIRDLLRLLAAPPYGVVAIIGMGLYWAADVTSLGACLAAFGAAGLSVAAIIVGYATGYALTRRSLPLCGAGAVEALLPFALSWVAVPLPQAVLAVAIYRALNLWLTLGAALVGLHYLRRPIAAVA